ncbi:unnamed protein product [Allacma fusca]|uniref:SMP-LTD domain-containing protein n=1 Tax=Allacma fusca TaxID=39272 RepID=A0A8J2P7X7_9HEXA|nr:unnamed protein product [Allacma fusca]
MSESRKGKITLSGLSKGSSSSSTFPSFRFSPENEEIEEIMLQDPTAEDRPQSLPESPKQSGSGGDVSPLKEMLKHKWANKWEKRSLSLDLDLKGKIITAIEDKRKSIFSQFIPEETGIIPPSTSIAEHIGYAGDSDHPMTLNSAKHLLESHIGTGEFHVDVEEVGLDYLANALQNEDNHLDQILKFNVAADLLQEYFGGYSPVYHHHPRNQSELPLSETIIEICKEDLKPITILNNILSAIASNGWTKYLIGLAAVALFLPFGSVFITPILWMLVGGIAVIIFQESLLCKSLATRVEQANDIHQNVHGSKSDISTSQSSSSLASIPAYSVDTDRSIQRYSDRSQGWMTEFEGEYDPFTCHVGLTRIVFVRLEGFTLYVSYPHPKHRIPKRPLWNDVPISSEITFVRHNVYNISGATVFIAPERLARKRAWNKKYPIAIRLPNHSVLTTVSPNSADNIVLGDSSTTEVSSSNHSQGDSKKTIEPKKEIVREDCSQRVIYLFSRTDREKDDWFRRIVASTMTGPYCRDSPETLSATANEQEHLQEYLEYMRKIIPNVTCETVEKPSKSLSKQDGKDHTGEKDGGKKDASVTFDKSESSSNSSKVDETPVSSRKGSPALLDDTVVLEKIFTVPHSPVFLNALIGRLFYDFLRSPYWTAKVNDLIQKKFNYIRRPQFLDALVVRDLDLGSAIPVIQRASSPFVDSQGLWIDLDLTYEGSITVTLETKLNLLKLRKSPSQETPEEVSQSGNANPNAPQNGSAAANDYSAASTKKSAQNTSSNGTNMNSGSANSHEGQLSAASSSTTISAGRSSTPHQAVPHMFDSDADDSGESSEDDTNPEDFIAKHPDSSSKDDVQNPSDSSSGASSKGKKILKMAEKIASSKYVQHATEMKVVKKAIANVANTPLVLCVELKSLIGTLVLNITPPPTDRLWMGFRHNPAMQISARPKFGARAVNLTHVTDWIQKKLLHEFQRVIVFPNMNDITIPLMEFKVPKVHFKESSDRPCTLVAKDFTYTSSNGPEHSDPKVKILKNSSLKITCVGLANKSFLLCTCSDDAVYLWKKDSLLREWGRKKVVKSLGKILHCAIFATDKHIFVTLSKFEEIIIIHCSSYVKLEPKGSLDLSSIDIYATIDKIKEPNSWITCFVLQGKLNVIGLAQGNGVSLRLWDVSRHNDIISKKLLDHKTVPQIKSIASADIFLQDRESFLVLFGCDGQVEVLLVAANGFSLINRIRVDDSIDERLKHVPANSFAKPLPPPTQSMKAEFRIISGHFFLLNSCKDVQPGNEADDTASENDSEMENSGQNNSLISACKGSVRTLCPQLLAIVATTKKILFLNLRSGEVELSVKYEDLDKNIGLMVNSIAVTYDEGSSELVGAMQLMMDKNIYFFRVGVESQDESSDNVNSCFLISSENYSSKSVLRKKLKSPRNILPKGTKSLSGLGSKRMSSRSRRILTSTSSGSFSTSSEVHLKSSYTTVSLVKKGMSRSGKGKDKGDCCKTIQSPRTGFPMAVPSSPRQSIILDTKSSYEDNQLFYDSPNSYQLPQRLSESGISSIRIGQSRDGRLMAVGANVSPLLVLKTHPFENLRLYKDTGRVSSVNFAFNSNYLLVATNDCKTLVLDWRGGKELLDFKFTSKFNEHIETVFYSNFVICGLSSKCLQVFDANTEKLAISIPQSHTRPLTCIRLNEAPKGSNATALCNFILTSAPSSVDPIKLWDLRTARSVSQLFLLAGVTLPLDLRIIRLSSTTFEKSTRVFSPLKGCDPLCWTVLSIRLSH